MIRALVGPTASGKSAIAMELGSAGTEIVSVDSMQVYRGMDIGTAKPTAAEMEAVPHHMIDLVEPEEVFSVAEFQRRGRAALASIQGSPLIVGGSGLHLRSLVDPLEFPPTDADVRQRLDAMPDEELTAALTAADPDAGELVDLANRRRVLRALEVFELQGLTPSARAESPQAQAVAEYRSEVPVTMVGVDAGEELAGRIERRVDAMFEAGWLDEVQALGERLGPTARGAVGYAELGEVVQGSMSLEEARGLIIAATRSLAKRQRTYFRRDPRIRWIPWNDDVGERTAAVRSAFEEAT